MFCFTFLNQKLDVKRLQTGYRASHYKNQKSNMFPSINVKFIYIKRRGYKSEIKTMKKNKERELSKYFNISICFVF